MGFRARSFSLLFFPSQVVDLGDIYKPAIRFPTTLPRSPERSMLFKVSADLFLRSLLNRPLITGSSNELRFSTYSCFTSIQGLLPSLHTCRSWSTGRLWSLPKVTQPLTTDSHPDKLAPQTLSKPLGYLVTNRVW